MSEHPLSEREELILRAVVHQYITSAEAVGSRAIVKKFNLDISPATVRNVMADLEESGYLQQIHTSSGRVPTDKGYRYYVDYLMRVQELTLTERERLESEIVRRMSDADAVMQETSRLLALLSHQTGLVQAPGLGEAVVRAIEVMPVSTERVAVLVVDNYGRVRTMIVPVTEPLSADEAGKLNPFLNDNLRGTPVRNLADGIQTKMRSYMDDQRHIAERAVLVLGGVDTPNEQTLFLEGVSQLMEQPEFHDVDRAREVFGLLEERERILDLLRSDAVNDSRPGSHIVIGLETSDKSLENISLVAAPYSIGERPVGLVGVLGPRRMPYSRLAGLVDYTAGMLSRLLTRLAN